MSLPIPSGSRSESRLSFRRLRVCAWLLLGLALAHVFFRVSEGALHPGSFFNADGLYLPSLYRDLFEDGGRWAGWRLTPAPYFFPDMALYFLLDALTGPFVHAIVAYAGVQVALLVLALQYLVRTAAPRSAAPLAQVVAVVAVAVLLLVHAEGHFWLMQFSVLSAFHFSLVPMSIVGLALALRALREGSKVAMGLLAMLCLLATASDALFIAAFVVPSVPCLGVLAWRLRPPPWKRLGVLVGLLALATVAGLRLSRHLADRSGSPDYIHVSLDNVRPTLERLHAVAAEQFQAMTAIALLWGALLLAVLAVVVSRPRQWTAPDSPRWGLYAVCLFTLLSLGSNTAAVVLTGTFGEGYSFRYLLVPVMLPLLSVAFLAGLVRREPWPRRLGVVVLALGALLWGTLVLRRPWRTQGPLISSYYPDTVRCLDAQQARYGLAWGVADYWHARYVSMFSRTGLRAHQLNPDGTALYWNNNRDWFLDRRGERSDYTFVIANGLDMAAFKARFGEPRESFRCEYFEVHVYGSGLDAPLRAELEEQLQPRKPSSAQAGQRLPE